jgi:cellulose synthase operon protein C
MLPRTCGWVLVLLVAWPAAAGVDDRAAAVAERRTQALQQQQQQYDELAREALQAEIEQAKKLLRDDRLALDPGVLAELLHRLASAYEQMARTERMRAVEAALAEGEACWDEGRSDCDELDLDLQGNGPQYDRMALQTYERLLSNHPSFQGLDEVRFHMALIHESLGDTEAALRGYGEMVERHPRSELAPDAWLALGEIRFDQGWAFKALQAYERAGSSTGWSGQTYAQYRAGWCQYNLGEYDAAIDSLETVIRTEDRQTAAGAPPPIPVRHEALRDLVRFLAEAHDVHEALDRLGRHADGPEGLQLLERMASLYSEQGRTDQAVIVHRMIVGRDPMAPTGPGHRAAVSEMLWAEDRFADGARELLGLLDDTDADAAWTRANADDAPALAEADGTVERALRRMAVDAYRQARGRRSDDLLLLAETLYDRYLLRWRDGDHTYEMAYWHAELLFDLGRYDQAADAYERVVEQDPEGKYVKNAAMNTIFAIEKVLEQL